MKMLDLLKQAHSLEHSLVDPRSRDGWEQYATHRLSPVERGLFRRLRRSDPQLIEVIERHACFGAATAPAIDLNGVAVRCLRCGQTLGQLDAAPLRRREAPESSPRFSRSANLPSSR